MRFLCKSLVVDGESGADSRSVTTVVLIHKEFVVGPASDIGPMPKTNFRRNSRVLLGEGWERPGRRVRNYVLHDEYGETYNTVALVQLKDPIRDLLIRPLCPPPEILRNPTFYVVRMKDDFDILQKEVINVVHIPGDMCKEFYVATNLYSKRMRPPHVACAVSVRAEGVCVWGAGAALVARDVWGRWLLLGVGVRGPGCTAPSRYLDMMSYYPWIETSLAKFDRITISKISKQKYVLRSSHAYQRFGACDEEEKVNLIFREVFVLRTNNDQYQFLTYNLTIIENVEYSCLTLELTNASAVSEMRVKHYCPRINYGPACYYYKGSLFEISVYLMFSTTCLFEMFAWGFKKNMSLIDIQEWKWEEGTYYEDFTMQRVEYRGQPYQTDFGYEPLDTAMWVPEYDAWTTTELDNSTTPTSAPVMVSRQRPSRPTTKTTTKRTKRTVRRKKTTTTKRQG
ncbi:uncharacterized protein LOC113502894 isoform X2 [Trichoplusia ni]|uniref:Uncharacterized protein LOC113502894 isoform X2 n=1 Tax=Trichoplusia ni TaxID=7111 RepID=A0A7E5WIC1_TRINI|nr:uncharacterized protein LOC113502894 isoform X2 [Trichoplusia ni]